jgi:hypothetical protein
MLNNNFRVGCKWKCVGHLFIMVALMSADSKTLDMLTKTVFTTRVREWKIYWRAFSREEAVNTVEVIDGYGANLPLRRPWEEISSFPEEDELRTRILLLIASSTLLIRELPVSVYVILAGLWVSGLYRKHQSLTSSCAATVFQDVAYQVNDIFVQNAL